MSIQHPDTNRRRVGSWRHLSCCRGTDVRRSRCLHRRATAHLGRDGSRGGRDAAAFAGRRSGGRNLHLRRLRASFQVHGAGRLDLRLQPAPDEGRRWCGGCLRVVRPHDLRSVGRLPLAQPDHRGSTLDQAIGARILQSLVHLLRGPARDLPGARSGRRASDPDLRRGRRQYGCRAAGGGAGRLRVDQVHYHPDGRVNGPGRPIGRQWLKKISRMPPSTAAAQRRSTRTPRTARCASARR